MAEKAAVLRALVGHAATALICMVVIGCAHVRPQTPTAWTSGFAVLAEPGVTLEVTDPAGRSWWCDGGVVINQLQGCNWEPGTVLITRNYHEAGAGGVMAGSHSRRSGRANWRDGEAIPGLIIAAPRAGPYQLRVTAKDDWGDHTWADHVSVERLAVPRKRAWVYGYRNNFMRGTSKAWMLFPAVDANGVGTVTVRSIAARVPWGHGADEVQPTVAVARDTVGLAPGDTVEVRARKPLLRW